MAVKLLKFIWEYFKVNLQSAMEYRVSFVTQVVFMFLNDIIWLLFWIIFFAKFTVINNWQFTDLVFMYAVIDSSWGLLGMFFGNFRTIAGVVRDGKLDFYLTLPKEELTHVLVSRSRFHAFGDLLFGIVLAIIFVPIVKVPLLIALIILSAIILLSFAIILGSLSFYMGSAVEVANQGMMGVLSFGSYPFSVFSGYTKFLLLTVIPAGFISGIPAELLRQFSWEWFSYMILAAVVLFVIAIVMFKKGIKRYESGNLINARV